MFVLFYLFVFEVQTASVKFYYHQGFIQKRLNNYCA